MKLVSQTRQVYRSPLGGRAYLTRRAAYSCWAKHIIARACSCPVDRGVRTVDGRNDLESCRIHRRDGDWMDESIDWLGVGAAIVDESRYDRVRERLARWLAWRDAAE